MTTLLDRTGYADDLSDMNADFSSYIAGLAANLLLVMTARPELVEPGSATKRIVKSGLRVHLPTYIGRKYEVIRKGPKGPANWYFTELGWRAGHYRRVHCGIGRKEEKIVLVDPYIAYTRGLVKEEVK